MSSSVQTKHAFFTAIGHVHDTTRTPKNVFALLLQYAKCCYVQKKSLMKAFLQYLRKVSKFRCLHCQFFIGILRCCTILAGVETQLQIHNLKFDVNRNKTWKAPLLFEMLERKNASRFLRESEKQRWFKRRCNFN